MKKINKKIGVIGVGNMGCALVNGFFASELLHTENIFVYDTDRGKLSKQKAKTTESSRKLADLTDVIIVAVKPQMVNSVLKEIKTFIDPSKIVVSIAAGITLSAIEAELGTEAKVSRVMPNTPAQVGESMSAITFNKNMNDEEKSIVESIFETIGKTVVLDEKYFDAVTGLSGSGPAYIFIAISALADGGVKMGLPRDVAMKLAVQTVKGAATLLEKSGQHPEKLKDSVCSPGGTTIAGVHMLEKNKLRAAFIDAVEAATKRSSELRR